MNIKKVKGREPSSTSSPANTLASPATAIITLCPGVTPVACWIS